MYNLCQKSCANHCAVLPRTTSGLTAVVNPGKGRRRRPLRVRAGVGGIQATARSVYSEHHLLALAGPTGVDTDDISSNMLRRAEKLLLELISPVNDLVTRKVPFG